MNKKLLKYSSIHALLATAYIFLVAAFVLYAPRKIETVTPAFFGPVVILLLLVISAAVMGILIFGRPVLMYLDNNKKDALALLFYTVGWLAVFLLVIILFVLMV